VAPIYRGRRRRNSMVMSLCVATAAFGLAFLVLILGALLWNGLAGLTPTVFIEMTPPPGASGGLLNAIVGSLIMTALGLPRSYVITKIAYRAARAGLITGVLLAVARISGETAPLLFTALNNQFWSTNLNAPMASLPAVIFQFALSPYKDWQQLAWTGALIITLAVLALSILARVLARQGVTK
jgi:phosphate transport system permease protein